MHFPARGGREPRYHEAMWSARALSRPEQWAALAAARVVHAPGLLTGQSCHAMLERITSASSEWTQDFGGDQLSLGRAWYTHYESGRTRHYFRDATRANALVERVLPGMQDGVRALVADFVGEPAVFRPGWCGPGVHLFVPGSPVAEQGGSIHFDLEGLRDEKERQRPALSVVVMLQPAERGGALRLWPTRYRGAMHPSEAEQAGAYQSHRYARGDAMLFESQRLHQIAPFSGAQMRVSITAHALRTDAGVWQVWF